MRYYCIFIEPVGCIYTFKIFQFVCYAYFVPSIPVSCSVHYCRAPFSSLILSPLMPSWILVTISCQVRACSRVVACAVVEGILLHRRSRKPQSPEKWPPNSFIKTESCVVLQILSSWGTPAAIVFTLFDIDLRFGRQVKKEKAKSTGGIASITIVRWPPKFGYPISAKLDDLVLQMRYSKSLLICTWLVWTVGHGLATVHRCLWANKFVCARVSSCIDNLNGALLHGGTSYSHCKFCSLTIDGASAQWEQCLIAWCRQARQSQVRFLSALCAASCRTYLRTYVLCALWKFVICDWCWQAQSLGLAFLRAA